MDELIKSWINKPHSEFESVRLFNKTFFVKSNVRKIALDKLVKSDAVPIKSLRLYNSQGRYNNIPFLTQLYKELGLIGPKESSNSDAEWKQV